MANRLTDPLEFQSQALLLRAQRQRLLAGNIANADTPGYLARDIDFAAALRDASGARALASRAAATHAAHLGGSGGTEPELKYATPAQSSLDGNSVDMDRERASFADNAVRYEATLRFVNGSVRTMLDAIKGQ